MEPLKLTPEMAKETLDHIGPEHWHDSIPFMDAVEGALLAISDGRLIVTQGWQPIESAPKDMNILLLLPPAFDGDTSRVHVGRWSDDKYAMNPRPYWRNDREGSLGTRWTRNYPPTHWMPLIEGPKP